MSSTTDIAAIPALAQLHATVDELTKLSLWRLSDDAVADLVAELERSARRLAFAGMRVVAEIDARNTAQKQAAVPTTEFLRQRLLISPSEAKSRVRAAAELIPSVAPSGETVPAALPEAAAGVAEGAISQDQVRVISRAIEKLPTGLNPAVRADAEAQLARLAWALDPTQLATAARRIHTILDPDGRLDADLPARRELAFVRDAGGCDIVRGRLDAEGAAILRTAIDPIATPEPQDSRSPARLRRIDHPGRAGDTKRAARHRPRHPHNSTGHPTGAHDPRPWLRSSRLPETTGLVRRHHVQSWLDGGPTALANLVLLCRKHHRSIHHARWRIVFLQGIPHVIPPPLIDPQQRPQRNTLHDP